MILLIFQTTLYSQNVSEVETSAASFLTIGVAARTTGMGDAFMANDNDAAGVYWNPASLGLTSRSQFVFSNSDYIQDMKLDFWVGTFAGGQLGTLALHRTSVKYPDEGIKTLDGTDEKITYSGSSFGISYANTVYNYISLGATIKRINEKIYHSEAKTWACDLGAIVTVPFHSLQFSFGWSHLGGKMELEGVDLSSQIDFVDGNNEPISVSMDKDEYDLPRSIRYGFAGDILDGLLYSNLNLVFNGVKPREDDWIFNRGLEYVFYDLLYLRTGAVNSSGEDYEKISTTGLGLRYRFMNRVTCKFDFAHLNFKTYEDVDIYTIGIEL